MRAYEESPWQQFGTCLTSVRSIGEAINAAGLEWPLTRRENDGFLQPRERWPEVLVREDLSPEDPGYVLGPVRRDQIPLSNLEAFQCFEPLIDSKDLAFDCGGYWKLGIHTQTWMTFRIQQHMDLGDGETIIAFLLYGHTPATGHYRLQYLSHRILCRNVLIEESFHNPEPVLSTPNFSPRRFVGSLESTRKQLYAHLDALTREFLAMQRTPIKSGGAESYFDRVLDASAKEESIRRRHQRSNPSREMVRAECMQVYETSDALAAARGTLWGAYNAVTEYVDHVRPSPGGADYLSELWFSLLKSSARDVARRQI